MIHTIRRWWYRGKRDRRRVAGVGPMRLFAEYTVRYVVKPEERRK